MKIALVPRSYSSWNPKRVLVAGLVALPGIIYVPQLRAASYAATKVIEWDISAMLGVPAIGSYSTALHVFAGDKHGKFDHKDLPRIPLLSGTPIPRELAESVEAGQFEGTVTKTPHLSFFLPSTFDQGHPLEVALDLKAVSGGKHAKSDAKVTITSRPPVDGIGKATLGVSGNATVTPIPAADGPETAYAESFGAADLKLTGKVGKTTVTVGKLPAVEVVVTTPSVMLQGSVDSAAGLATYNDPISLAIYDDVTGDFVAGQDLWDEEFTVEGMASLFWNETDGLLMSAGAGGSAEMSFETLGSWVANPFEGSASIVNGLFTATGILESLPWALSTVDGETRVMLAPSEFSLLFALQIVPDGLGTPLNDLRLELSSEGDSLAQEYQTVAPVPEQTSVVGGALVFCAAAYFSKRRQGAIPSSP